MSFKIVSQYISYLEIHSIDGKSFQKGHFKSKCIDMKVNLHCCRETPWL